MKSAEVINRKPRPYSQSERDQGGVTPLTHPLRSPDTIYLRRYIQTVTNNNKTTHLNAAPFALSSFYLNHYFANDLLICIWFNLKWFKSLIQWFKIIFFSFQQHLIHTQNYLVQKSWNIIMVVLVILLIFYSFIYNQTLTFKGFNVENEFHIFIQRKLTTYFKYKPWRKPWTH